MADARKPPSISFAVTLASIAMIGPLTLHMFLPALPAVKAAFGLSDALAQAAFSVALFAMGFSTLVYGTLSDRYGRRIVLLAGLVLFLVGSTITMLAVSAPMLFAGRLIQALGAGCGAPLSRAIARDVYGQEALVKAIAYLTMAYTLGPMVAPLVAGGLLDHFGWQAVFAFALGAGLLIALAAFLVIGETRVPQAGSPAKSSAARDYATLFSHLRFTSMVLHVGFNTAVFFVLASASSVIMQEVLKRPATEYAAWFLVFPAGYAIGNWVSARLSKTVAAERMVLAGGSLLAVAAVAQTWALATGWVTTLTLFVPGLVSVFAQGLSLPAAQASAIGTVPRLAGTASGIAVFMQTVIAAAAVQVFGFLADGTVWPLIWVTAVSAGLALVTGVVPILMGSERSRETRG